MTFVADLELAKKTPKKERDNKKPREEKKREKKPQNKPTKQPKKTTHTKDKKKKRRVGPTSRSWAMSLVRSFALESFFVHFLSRSELERTGWRTGP